MGNFDKEKKRDEFASEYEKLRDEFAKSLPHETIPTLPADRNQINVISYQIGMAWVDDDAVIQIKWALRYQAWVRYQYANMMMEMRKV